MAHGQQCVAQGAVCFGMRLYTETGLKVPGEVSAYKFRSIVRYCARAHIILSGLEKWTAESPWSMVVFHLPLVWWLVKAKEQGTHGWLLKFSTTFSHELTTVSKVGYQVGHLEERKCNGSNFYPTCLRWVEFLFALWWKWNFSLAKNLQTWLPKVPKMEGERDFSPL